MTNERLTKGLSIELQRRGYKAVIARGYSACLDAIKDYFSEDNLGL